MVFPIVQSVLLKELFIAAQAMRMAVDQGRVVVVHLQPRDQQEERHRGEHGGDADQHAAVLPPGDPDHPPPRHGPRRGAGVLAERAGLARSLGHLRQLGP